MRDRLRLEPVDLSDRPDGRPHPDRAILDRITDPISRAAYEALLEQDERLRAYDDDTWHDDEEDGR